MKIHLQREIEVAKKMLLNLSAEVEESLNKTLIAIKEADVDLAQSVVDYDDEIDRLEVETEEECLKILALHQPVAVDLRFIVAVIKITNSLERIADNIANIAKRSIHLAASNIIVPNRFQTTAEIAQGMLRNSLDALINLDTALARSIIAADDQIDNLHKKNYVEAVEAIQKNPADADNQINFLSISRQIERICDLVTNIAEDTIYMVDGEIVRHREFYEE